MRLSLADVLAATGGVLAGGREPVGLSSYHTDSREVRSGGLFFALRGAAPDGHAYIGDAVTAGAAAVVVDRDVEAGGAAVVRGAHTGRALYGLGADALARGTPA